MDGSDEPTLTEAPHNDLAAVLSLDGQWQFALGKPGEWAPIRVPGSWEAQGFSKHEDGPAFYRRSVDVPSVAEGARVFLELDAVSYACEVQLNGGRAGSHIGMWTPFSADVTAAIRPGRNTLDLEVWKPGTRYPVRQSLAGFLPDVASTFGGIWQSARLRVLSDGFADARVCCVAESGEVRLCARAVTFGGRLEGAIELEVLAGTRLVARQGSRLGAGGKIDLRARVPDRALWEPGNPALYEVCLRWVRDGVAVAEWKRRVGFRTLAADGARLLLNGKPFFLRGALSWGWDPAIIAPLYDREAVRRELAGLRELGFNTVKLCLFIPNQHYFDVADEEGMLLWQEFPLWLPEVTPDLARRAPAEYEAYMRLTGDHPSVALYTLGCELGAGVTPQLLGELDRAVRSAASGALVCDNSGSGESYGGYDFDLADFTDYHPYYDLHWFEPLLDNWRRDWREARPWIFGEFCDQDGFRDLGELVSSNGGITPWWMTEDLPIASWRPEARAIVEAASRLDAAKPGFAVAEMVRVANAQALVTRKFTFEAVRRRAGMGGYVVTGLRDTPIATSGLFDDRGRPKWVPGDFRMFNAEAALCLEVPRRRRWTYGGDRPDRIDPHSWWAGSHASWSIVLDHTLPELPGGAVVQWRLARRHGDSVASGRTVQEQALAPGAPRLVGTIDCTLPDSPRAEELELSVELCSGSNTVANRWPIWVYPPPKESFPEVLVYDPSCSLEGVLESLRPGARVDSVPRATPGRIVLATAWDASVRSYLEAGGRVLLWQQSAGPLPASRGPFWREAVKLFAPHRIWQSFPHAGYADLQFFGLATDVMLDARRLADLLPGGSEVLPVMRRLDARSFAVHEYILEARVGGGVMIATTLRFHGGQGAQPSGLERNVAGRALLCGMIGSLAEG